VVENAGSVILTVQRTGDTNAAVSVDYPGDTNGGIGFRVVLAPGQP
jgi:hypothetical protein